ncbi:MAG: ATP-binding cassette domain-containing protein [Lachnospiraceae bacterium]|nr:ATP-binding cassette domain-containing protein [Lachnospiraceae bacterium]
MGILELKDVSYTYENAENPVIDGISLGIEKGEFIGIIGGNGSGKSTLSHLFNALKLPTEGVVLVDSMDTQDENVTFEIRKTCGLVFQNPDNQIVSSTVEEDVAFGLENIGFGAGADDDNSKIKGTVVAEKEGIEAAKADVKADLNEDVNVTDGHGIGKSGVGADDGLIINSRIENRIDEALSKVGMIDYKNSSPWELSGGQKQRVAIAGILAMKPKCIVLDEPTSMLDPKGRAQIIDVLKDLNKKENITIIIITHFPEEAVDCDRVVVMSHGNIRAVGTPADIYTKAISEDLLKECNIKRPYMAEISYRLAKEGYKEFEGVLKEEDLLEKIKKLKGK